MLKSPTKRKKDKRNEQIRAELMEFSTSGAMKIAAVDALAKKYHLSPSTVYRINRGVSSRQQAT
ncbi:hypothetical protein EXU85_20580 [Spirosoma sp. KCTC 42546]|uniref:hypothetical protein n=1 Tax=Spirosoma sp. KCTC 42546 TaxID=2520506 RepID=UPI001157C49B|nr:hypothetical protein [Spirosoma sp. KCTC 42546]QDK80877.1 hypothetical protein EXU85_20580 [Spirosoma sp. KCTC 42546]